MPDATPTSRTIFIDAGEELSAAYRALGDAGDCLRGPALSGVRGQARSDIYDAITEAKAAINRAKDAVSRALAA